MNHVIEITLGSHFCVGGVYVNEKTETTIPGLFAAGEIIGAFMAACDFPAAASPK